MHKIKKVLLYVFFITAIILWLNYASNVITSIEKLINGGEFFSYSINSPFFKDNILNFVYKLLELVVNIIFYFLLSVILVYLSKGKEGLKELFSEISSLFTKRPITSLLFGLYIPFMTHIMVVLLPVIHKDSLFYAKMQVDIIQGWPFWLGILEVFVFAFYEELVMRILIYRGLSKALNNTFALLFSLFLFTILHENRIVSIGVSQLNDFQLYMIQMPYYFSSGLLFTYLIDSRKSFWTAVGAHFCVNYFFAEALNTDYGNGIFVVLLITISQTTFVVLDYIARDKFYNKKVKELETLT